MRRQPAVLFSGVADAAADDPSRGVDIRLAAQPESCGQPHDALHRVGGADGRAALRAHSRSGALLAETLMAVPTNHDAAERSAARASTGKKRRRAHSAT